MHQTVQLSSRIVVAGKLVAFNSAGQAIGEGHHRARLSDADVDLILALRDYGLSYPAIAAKFDDLDPPPSVSTVRDICLGRRRAQVAHSFRRKP